MRQNMQKSGTVGVNPTSTTKLIKLRINCFLSLGLLS